MSRRNLGAQSTVSLTLANKPQFPKSTPAPGPNGRLNAYTSLSSLYCGTQSTIYDNSGLNTTKRATKRNSSSKKPQPASQDQSDGVIVTKKTKRNAYQRSKRISMESLPSQASIFSNTSSMNTALAGLIRDLPFDDREKVTSLVNMAVYSSECFQKECLAISIELKSLQSSYRVKYGELRAVEDECDVYRSQLAEMEEKLSTLEDDAESRQNYALRNSKAISRLSSTNKTLIDAFALIHEENPKKKNGAVPSGQPIAEEKQPSDVDGVKKFAGGGVKLSPLDTKKSKKSRKKDSKTNPNAIDPYEGTPVTSNEKLRERLLRVAKEHNRVEKNCEGLESKIMGLRSSLRVAERRNRQLQLELDELKEHLSSDNSGHHFQLRTAAAFCAQLQTEVVKTKKVKSQMRVPMTNRLNALVSRNAFDATEGIKQIDALISHLAHTPSSMKEADIAFHLCTRYACRLFDSEGMVLYILQPGGKVMHRYATGSSQVTILEVGEEASIAENTLRTGAMRRYNNNLRNNSFFNPAVDSIPAMNTKRVLTFPLRNQDKTLVVGAMHLLNKRNNNKFTEVDELYGSAFSDVIGSFFSLSILFKRMWLESETLCGIMRASRKLLELLPPITSIVATRPLLPEEALFSIEHVIRNSLKCSQAKAFLLSKYCGYTDEFFITLDKPSTSMLTLKPEHLACTQLPIHSGIAGHVAFTKTSYLVSEPSSDALVNTQIDVSSECDTFYCVPVLNNSRDVIAIIQVVPSALSPNMKSSKEMGDSTLAFENSIDWLLYLLSANLNFMVNSIGSPTPRPDFQYLEPITLTEKFANTNLSLEAVILDEEDGDTSAMYSKPSSPIETGRQRSATMDDDPPILDGISNVDGKEEGLQNDELGNGTDVESDCPRPDDISEKYERQILALQTEIDSLNASLNAMDETEEHLEEETRIRNELQSEYTTKYETDLIKQKASMKRSHDEDVKALGAIDSELELLRDQVQLMAAEHEKAEEGMRLEESRLNDETTKIIESLCEQSLNVEIALPKDKPVKEGIEHEKCLEDVYIDSTLQHSPDKKSEMIKDNVVVPTDDLTVPVSARSHKSTRSEIPPTPTKEEVESSPRIGNWMECFDDNGFKYYYNTETEESSWDKPDGFIEVTAVDDTYDENDNEETDVVHIGDWTQATTDDGHVYWIHDITGESTWDTPTDDNNTSSLLSKHNPQGHSQSAPVLSQYGGNAKATAGDYSIEL